MSLELFKSPNLKLQTNLNHPSQITKTQIPPFLKGGGGGISRHAQHIHNRKFIYVWVLSYHPEERSPE